MYKLNRYKKHQRHQGFAAAGFRFLQFDFGGGIRYLRLSDSSAVVDNLQWTASAVYRVGLIAAGSSLKYVSLEDTSGVTRRTAAVNAGLGIHVFDLMTLASRSASRAGG